jgi:hypothetical protein
MDARHLQRRARLDAGDIGMGMRRAQDRRMQLIGKLEIVEKAAAPAQQARVLAPQHRLADGKFTHDVSEPAMHEPASYDVLLCENAEFLRGGPASRRGSQAGEPAAVRGDREEYEATTRALMSIRPAADKIDPADSRDLART